MKIIISTILLVLLTITNGFTLFNSYVTTTETCCSICDKILYSTSHESSGYTDNMNYYGIGSSFLEKAPYTKQNWNCNYVVCNDCLKETTELISELDRTKEKWEKKYTKIQQKRKECVLEEKKNERKKQIEEQIKTLNTELQSQ